MSVDELVMNSATRKSAWKDAASSHDTVKKPRSNYLGLWIFLLGLFVIELVFYTWCRVQCTQLGYEMVKDDEIHQKLSALKNSMVVELARLKSPDRISEIARQQLKLEPPSRDQMVVLP